MAMQKIVQFNRAAFYDEKRAAFLLRLCGIACMKMVGCEGVFLRCRKRNLAVPLDTYYILVYNKFVRLVEKGEFFLRAGAYAIEK